MLSVMPNVSLALLLLFIRVNLNNLSGLKGGELKFAAKWSAYLMTLPNEFHTPLFFDLDEIMMLKSSQCFGSVVNHVKNIVRQYAYIFNLLDTKVFKKKCFLVAKILR